MVDRATKIAAAAARALMLEPKESFAVPVSGDLAYAEECAGHIMDALERQYESGRDMVCMAHPEEIEVLPKELAPGKSCIILGRSAGV